MSHKRSNVNTRWTIARNNHRKLKFSLFERETEKRLGISWLCSPRLALQSTQMMIYIHLVRSSAKFSSHNKIDWLSLLHPTIPPFFLSSYGLWVGRIRRYASVNHRFDRNGTTTKVSTNRTKSPTWTVVLPGTSIRKTIPASNAFSKRHRLYQELFNLFLSKKKLKRVSLSVKKEELPRTDSKMSFKIP